MNTFVGFMQHTDLASESVFAAQLCSGAAQGSLDATGVRRLMCVSQSIRHSPGMLVVLSFLARRAHTDGNAGLVVHVCRLVFPLRTQCKAAAGLYRVALHALPAVVPAVYAFNTHSVAHSIARGVARANPVFDSVLALLERQMNGSLEHAHVRANMQAAVVCLHRCMVEVKGRMHLVDEDKTFPIDLLYGLGTGLVDKYHLLTHDPSVEYVTVSVLECLCGYGYDARIFRHIIARFCDCLAAGNTLMVVFIHHTLLRLMGARALNTFIATSLDENNDIDCVVTCVYSASALSASSNLAAACVVAEMIGTTKRLSVDAFARIEQLVTCMRLDSTAEVHESYIFVLARAALFTHGRMNGEIADRAMHMLADLGLRVCAPDSRTHEHINATLHFMLVQRRYIARPETWHLVARYASTTANRLGAATPLTTLAVLLAACRHMSYAHLVAVVEATLMLGTALREPEFVMRPKGVGLVLRILRTYMRRTGSLSVMALRRVVEALGLEHSIAALCVQCVEYGVASNNEGRAAVLYLADSLFAFSEHHVLQPGAMQLCALRVLTSNLQLSTPHNVVNITRTHKALHLLLRQIPQLAAFAEPRHIGDLFGAAVHVCAGEEKVRVSALKLLCELQAKNECKCACALGGGHEKRCHGVVAFCARALSGQRASDWYTYRAVQELLLGMSETPAHAPSPSSTRVKTGIVVGLAAGLRAHEQRQQYQMDVTPTQTPAPSENPVNLLARNARIVAAMGRL